jgi:flagellar biosynthesis/type III secretory pathway M-ring protein FliF/YscJ
MHRVIEQVPPEKLKSIRDLVAAATGFSAERGDQLIVESLPFESTLNLEPPLPAGPGPKSTNNVSLPKWVPPWLARALDNRYISIGAPFCLGLLLMVLRRVFAKMFGRKGKAAATSTAALPSGDGDAQRAELLRAQLQEQAELQAQLDSDAVKIAGGQSKKADVMVKRLRDSVTKDATLSAHIVRGWLNENN